jgi:hypothetical protein
VTIPANITSELAALQQQTAAAQPLASASRPTITAIQLNAGQLLSDIDVALLAAAGSLDTWTPPTDPDAIVAGILGLLESADDQAGLCNMEGYVGRAAKNLDQLV